MATRPDPVFTLNDGSARVPAHMKAQVVAFTPEEQARISGGKLGSYTQVIDRSTPIEVIRGEFPGAPREFAPAPPVLPPVPTNPMRRDAMDDIMGAQGVITQGGPVPVTRGIYKPPPANAIVVRNSPEALKAAGLAVPPQPPAAPLMASAAPQPTTLPAVSTSTTVVRPTPPVAPTTSLPPQVDVLTAVMPPIAASIPPLKRETVILSSPTIGKHRLKVAQLLVSASVVVLVYEDDDDATIYEPPPAGGDQALTVEHGGQSYQCVYHGLSVSQPVLGNPHKQLLLVVLVRL